MTLDCEDFFHFVNTELVCTSSQTVTSLVIALDRDITLESRGWRRNQTLSYLKAGLLSLCWNLRQPVLLMIVALHVMSRYLERFSGGVKLADDWYCSIPRCAFSLQQNAL